MTSNERQTILAVAIIGLLIYIAYRANTNGVSALGAGYQNEETWLLKRDQDGNIISVTVHRDARVT